MVSFSMSILVRLQFVKMSVPTYNIFKKVKKHLSDGYKEYL